ncbi:DUF3306 domain-containing protein [Acidovorax sp. FG27]|uniref:DUF3306 domain-containing protein n=1 Tax=Acidovorax sp. FG27 TaxID=3133652 RepID=UPI0030E828C5
MADEGGFLGRWSRRKQLTREGAALPDAVPAPPPTALRPDAAAPLDIAAVPADPAGGPAPAAQPPAVPTLQDVAALDRQSDFSPFVARTLSPEVRNAAMRKLFTDPHFNVMDGLDIYIDDYSLPDPLPAGMLNQLASARSMGLVSDGPASGTAEAGPDHAATGAESSTAGEPQDMPDRGAGDVGELPVPQGVDVAQSRVCNAIPSQPAPAAAPPSSAAAAEAHASQSPDVQDADMRLQPDHAARLPGAGRGAS